MEGLSVMELLSDRLWLPERLSLAVAELEAVGVNPVVTEGVLDTDGMIPKVLIE